MFKSTRWCVLWTIVTMILAKCSTPVKTELGWHHYWRPPGKPVQVYNLTVSGKWLWIATRQGIMRVNQHTLAYKQFPYTGDSPDTSSDRRTTLLVDDKGRLWVGRGDGLTRYDGDSGGTTITTMPAHAFALDVEGNVWVFFHDRYGGGAFRFRGQEPPPGGNWEPERITETSQWDNCEAWRFLVTYSSLHECDATPNGRIVHDAGGVDWSRESFDKTLTRRDGETLQTIFLNRGYVRAIAAAGVRDGVWIGLDRGLFYGKGQTVREYSATEDKLVPWGSSVRAFAFTSDGRVWVSTSNGLFRLDEEQDEWQPIAAGGGTLVEGSAPIAADEQGNLWALYVNDLARFDGQTWQRWGLPAAVQLCDPESRAIGEFRGEVWVAAGTCGLWRFDGETWNKASVDAGVALFTHGLDGKFYAISNYGIIYVYDKARWVELLDPKGSGTWGKNRPAIAVDADGGVWKAWTERVTHLRRYIPGGEWTQSIPLPPDSDATALLLDSQGNLWIGCQNKVLRCDEKSCASWDFFANVLAQDPQGRTWVGGQGWLSVYDPAAEDGE